jgi:hypothetical protein
VADRWLQVAGRSLVAARLLIAGWLLMAGWLLVAGWMLAALIARPAAMSADAESPKPADACALVADADVRAVLGAAVTERRPAAEQARGLLLSQCYLGTGTPRSVCIAIAGSTQSGGKTVTPRAFWRAQFHGRDDDAAERSDVAREPARNGAHDEPERETKAKPIRGVGDEAFWSGTRVAGALYALRGDTFIRVSVGGIRDEPERIETSRRLAMAALGRLAAPLAR